MQKEGLEPTQKGFGVLAKIEGLTLPARADRG